MQLAKSMKAVADVVAHGSPFTERTEPEHIWHIWQDEMVPFQADIIHCKAVVYLMSDGNKHYIGVTTRLDTMDSYWSSGMASRPYFNKHKKDTWRVILQLVPHGYCPYKTEARWQNMVRVSIRENNHMEGGEWLNLRIGMPGMECYWQHPESTKKQGSGSHSGHTGGGGRSPILMKLLNGEYLRFETSKAASAWLGITQNGGLLRQYLVDANWNVVPHDHPHALRNADPTSRYRMKGVEWVCYDR